MDEIYADSERRERLLGRIRSALSVPTGKSRRRPTRSSVPPNKAPADSLPVLDSVAAAREWLPPVPSGWEERWTLFESISERLKTETIRVSSLSAAAGILRELARQADWTRGAWHDHPLVKPLADEIDLFRVDTTDSIDSDELESCDVGITGCDALIAQTASVLVTSHSSGGRALSVLPPHHVVIADRSQLVATIADGFARLRDHYRTHWPSFCSLITGPSRTADIERILVLGAHGPRRLTVILIDSGQAGEGDRAAL